MAKRKSLAWTELRVGMLVIASFVLLALAIFYVGGEANFFTRHYDITAYFASANGLRPGAAVWLEGVPVGDVQQVLISTSTDPSRSVKVQLHLDQTYQTMIRTDSEASIGTIGLLGDKYVDITRGTTAGQAIPPGGSLQGEEVGDIKKIITGTNDFIENLDVLSEQVKKLSEQVQSGQGTLGKFMTDTSVYDNANATMKDADQLVQDIAHGNGTAGKLVSDDALYQKWNDLSDRLNDLVQKIDSGQGSFAKFVNDSTLYDHANDLLGRLQTMADKVDRGEGSLGKFIHDDTIANDTHQVLQRTQDLLTTAENGDGTMGKLIKDPTLYNSINQTSSEILKLLYDFRQDPKKFLTINFKLF